MPAKPAESKLAADKSPRPPPRRVQRESVESANGSDRLQTPTFSEPLHNKPRSPSGIGSKESSNQMMVNVPRLAIPRFASKIRTSGYLEIDADPIQLDISLLADRLEEEISARKILESQVEVLLRRRSLTVGEASGVPTLEGLATRTLQLEVDVARSSATQEQRDEAYDLLGMRIAELRLQVEARPQLSDLREQLEGLLGQASKTGKEAAAAVFAEVRSRLERWATRTSGLEKRLATLEANVTGSEHVVKSPSPEPDQASLIGPHSSQSTPRTSLSRPRSRQGTGSLLEPIVIRTPMPLLLEPDRRNLVERDLSNDSANLASQLASVKESALASSNAVVRIMTDDLKRGADEMENRLLAKLDRHNTESFVALQAIHRQLARCQDDLNETKLTMAENQLKLTDSSGRALNATDLVTKDSADLLIRGIVAESVGKLYPTELHLKLAALEVDLVSLQHSHRKLEEQLVRTNAPPDWLCHEREIHDKLCESVKLLDARIQSLESVEGKDDGFTQQLEAMEALEARMRAWMDERFATLPVAVASDSDANRTLLFAQLLNEVNPMILRLREEITKTGALVKASGAPPEDREHDDDVLALVTEPSPSILPPMPRNIPSRISPHSWKSSPEPADEPRQSMQGAIEQKRMVEQSSSSMGVRAANAALRERLRVFELRITRVEAALKVASSTPFRNASPCGTVSETEARDSDSPTPAPGDVAQEILEKRLQHVEDKLDNCSKEILESQERAGRELANLSFVIRGFQRDADRKYVHFSDLTESLDAVKGRMSDLCSVALAIVPSLECTGGGTGEAGGGRFDHAVKRLRSEGKFPASEDLLKRTVDEAEQRIRDMCEKFSSALEVRLERKADRSEIQEAATKLHLCFGNPRQMSPASASTRPTSPHSKLGSPDVQLPYRPGSILERFQDFPSNERGVNNAALMRWPVPLHAKCLSCNTPVDFGAFG